MDTVGLSAERQLLAYAGYCIAVATLFPNEEHTACATAASASETREALGSLLSTGEVTPQNSV